MEHLCLSSKEPLNLAISVGPDVKRSILAYQVKATVCQIVKAKLDMGHGSV